MTEKRILSLAANVRQLIWWPAWLLVTGVFTYAFVLRRYDAYAAGTGMQSDLYTLAIWVGLLAAPLFGQVSVFGFSLKREIDDLKIETKREILNLRSEISNSVNINIVPVPPPDHQLRKIADESEPILEAAMKERKAKPVPANELAASLSDEVLEAFSARYAIEKELRRIWSEHGEDAYSRRTSWARLVENLREAQVIDSGLSGIVREVYAVCSPAVHGGQVSQDQLAFVRRISPELVATLRSL